MSSMTATLAKPAKIKRDTYVFISSDSEPPFALSRLPGASGWFMIHRAGPAPGGKSNWPLQESAGAQGKLFVELPTTEMLALGLDVPQPVP